MSVLADNVSALQRRHPRLYDTILSTATRDKSFKALPSKTGAPTARVHNQFLHSSYNPEQEAIRAVQRYACSAAHTYIFYGFGLGYYVEALQNKVGEQVDVYIIIDNIDHFYSALHCRALHNIFNREHTHYLLHATGNTLVQLIQHMSEDSFHIVRIASLVALNKTYFAQLNSAIQTFLVRKRGNINTTIQFSLAWMANCLRNMPTITQSVDCAHARAHIGALPVLLIAAGPTVDMHLAHVRQYAHKVCIIAVDTVCNALHAAGIVPDVIVGVDPQYWNSRHLDHSQYQHSILLYDPCVYPRVLRGQYRHTMTFATAVPIIKVLQQHFTLRNSLGAGGTVASVGWEFARWIGAAQIFVLGFDFGYPQLKIHCNNCTFERDMMSTGHILRSTETLYHRYLCNSALKYTQTYGGAPLLSDATLLTYAQWFAGHIAQYKQPQTVTISTHGARIAGVTHLPAAQLAELPDIRDQKTHFLHALQQLPTVQEELTDSTAGSATAAFGTEVMQIARITREIMQYVDKERSSTDSSSTDSSTRDDAIRTHIARTSLGAPAQETVRSLLIRYTHARPAARQQITDAIQKIIRRISRIPTSP